MRTARVILFALIFVIGVTTGQTQTKRDEFSKAVMSADLTEIKNLLKADPSLAKGEPSASHPPLHLVAAQGRKDIAELLIQNGADVNAKRPFGAFLTHSYTALHVAAARGHKDIVELLLKNGADINARNLEAAAYRGDNWAMTPMHSAVIGGNISIVKALSDKNARADETNYGGLRPLYYAADKGDTNIVALLLKNNADINAKAGKNFTTRLGQTALHAAARKGHLDVVKLLIENRADMEAKDEGGKTALDEAKGHNHQDVVRLLLNARTK